MSTTSTNTPNSSLPDMDPIDAPIVLTERDLLSQTELENDDPQLQYYEDYIRRIRAMNPGRLLFKFLDQSSWRWERKAKRHTRVVFEDDTKLTVTERGTKAVNIDWDKVVAVIDGWRLEQLPEGEGWLLRVYTVTERPDGALSDHKLTCTAVIDNDMMLKYCSPPILKQANLDHDVAFRMQEEDQRWE